MDSVAGWLLEKMASILHEFRARMIECYVRSYLVARGYDAAIVWRDGAMINVRGNYIVNLLRSYKI